MSFRTPLLPHLQPPFLSHTHKILTLGSCFAGMIGNQLARHKFEVLHNPLGIAYNPLSLIRMLEIGLGTTSITWDRAPHGAYWHSFDLHSQFTHPDHARVRDQVAQAKESLSNQIQQMQWLILTMGTAHVYRHRKRNLIVNNCHKYPKATFEKYLLGLDEMTAAWEQVYPLLPPNIHILLTVSPIRHIKDGIPENMVSKSLLRVFCHQLSARYENVHYHPSYEVMMDDLRDYRFYQEDMLHPSRQAESYIWQHFVQSRMEVDTQSVVTRWAKFLTSFEHKPLQPWSPQYKVFLENLLHQLQMFASSFNVDNEETTLKERINMLE
ncbi:MAG: GSCFA domain-containing protein [Bacteroidota bacterium]